MYSDRNSRIGMANDQPAGVATEVHSRRLVILKWLRKTHGWIGLWGAALGLLFGATGILLNHRAILKIPAAQVQEMNVQLPLPDPRPADADAMAAWLEKELRLDRPAARVRSEPSRPVAWGDKALAQPARWTVTFNSPRSNVQAEYWVGNEFANVKRSENNLFGLLNNLHKSAGVGVGWVLLADTLGGAIILLSVTGVLLWAMTHRRRMIGLGIALASLGCLLGIAIATA
ncbi:MAG TPA: PepSY-associated TM helix domain-containing protein [Burkholderiales bacterium]|nr:PepSY-associated TM helix domain-containing protein [Burkholderiales bacterium]